MRKCDAICKGKGKKVRDDWLQYVTKKTQRGKAASMQ